MSRLRTNLITNRMANGAPTVSNGLVISGVTTTSDIKVGTGATLNVYGGATFSGIVTASSFKGDGSQLSNITSTTINNNADNRIITGSGTANTLEGEAGLTYDGSQLIVRGSDTVTSSGGTKTVALRGGDANNEKVNLSFETGAGGPIAVISGIADATGVYPNTTGSLTFNTQVGGGVFERLRIKSNGQIVLGSDGTNSEITFTQDGTSGTQLNATTTGSGGYNTLSINSATFIHKYGSNERLRIHSDGRIQPKYPSSAGATGGIIMVGGFAAQPSAHAGEGVVQAKTNTNANCFDAGGWYNNSTYRYTPQVKGHYIFHGTGMMYTGMNGSSCEQSVYFVKNNSAGSGNVPQYATGYSTNYGNYDLHHITNVIYMNGTTDYVHFHLSSNQSVQVHSGSMWSGFLLYPAA